MIFINTNNCVCGAECEAEKVGTQFKVECYKCGKRTPLYIKEEQAVYAWNKMNPKKKEE